MTKLQETKQDPNCCFCEVAAGYPRQTEKLVRDRIPEIIKNTGRSPIIRTLSQEEHLSSLYEKLIEEHIEFREAYEISELVDMLDVLFSIAKLKGLSQAELQERLEAKRHKNGGFEKGYYYEGVHE